MDSAEDSGSEGNPANTLEITPKLRHDLEVTRNKLQESAASTAVELEKGFFTELINNINTSAKKPRPPIMPPVFETIIKLCHAIEAINRVLSYDNGRETQQKLVENIVAIFKFAQDGDIRTIGISAPAGGNANIPQEMREHVDLSIKALVEEHHAELLRVAKEVIANATPRISRFDRMVLDGKLNRLAEQFTENGQGFER